MKSTSLLAIVVATITATTNADAALRLKEGTFECENKYYETILLKVKYHPTKPNKIIVNWEGRDRILHYVDSVSGALRYEGAVSGLVYIQVPQRSVLLDSITMHPVLMDCTKKLTASN